MFCVPHDKLINGKWRHEIDQPQCEDSPVTPVPGICKTNYECGKEMTCYNSKCLKSCTQENDCLLGQYCQDHRVCHDFCQNDNDCSVGYICHENGECLKECFDQDDCNENQLCDR